jgi:probable HAF family extracellular repeat protein
VIAQQTSTNNFTKIDYPGATGTDVTRINDAGQIVGYYYDSSGNTHGFLLSGATETTPEFGSLVGIISICSIIGMLMVSRKFNYRIL